MKTRLLTVFLFPLPAALVAFAQPPGTVLWTYQAAYVIHSSPALADDGTVYLVAGGLQAITNSGSVASNKWSFPVAPEASPAIASDGTIYVAAGDLYAINPEGSQKWRYSPIPAGGGGTPAIAVDGTTYFQAYTGLHAITSAGNLKWKSAVGDSIRFSSPVIGPDGTIYMVSNEFGELYAIKPDGNVKWFLAFRDTPNDSPAVGGDGTIFLAAGPVYAYTPEGDTLWTSSAGRLDGPPVIAKDGTLCVSGYQSRDLYAMAPDGKTMWGADWSWGSRSWSPAAAVDSAGVIYYCVGNGINALGPDGKVRWTITQPLPPPDNVNTSPIIGPDGTVYATLNTTLYAIASGTNGPADSPWPMYRGNARHTGRIEKPSLQKPGKRSDANFEFHVNAQVGKGLTVEASTNLQTWNSLTSFVPTEASTPSSISARVTRPPSSTAPSVHRDPALMVRIGARRYCRLRKNAVHAALRLVLRGLGRMSGRHAA